MRVDPNPSSQPLLENTRNQNATQAGSGSQSTASVLGIGEDQADLQAGPSSSAAQAQTLERQLSELPDTRQETVNALRQAILGGSYQSAPSQISEALFAHMLVTSSS
jgi:flagellar biosynthesis anti-sigma factor FlgM